MNMENLPEQENAKITLQKLKNEDVSSVTFNHDEVKVQDCISDAKNKFKESKVEKSIDAAKETKLRKSLTSLCKMNPLDESSDFIECEIEKRLKNGSQKQESVLCEICKEDITHLTVQNREIHVNNCIDKQISCSSKENSQTIENENVFILECPLCFKNFSTPELRSNHIKKCGKSKGLNTQSIIKALELQERHMLERISLGLPPKPIKAPKVHKNPTSKRMVAEPKNKSDSDFQLAKALSLSLASSSQQEDSEISENVTVMTLKPPTTNQRPGKKSKAALSNARLLVLRSEEDRKRLLLQKVEAILSAASKSEFNSSGQDLNETSYKQQDDIQKELPVLWNLASTTAEKSDYYVELLLDWIKPSDHEVGDKLFHLSQIPGHEIVTQLPCDYTFSVAEEKNTCVPSSKEPLTADLCCPVTECLSSLVASSWMSDVDIHTACGTIIPAHKLLLALRCPPLKEDLQFCSDKGRGTLKWGTVSFDTALQFLNYIYTGNIKINNDITSDLLYLANKYEVHGLKSMIFTNEKMAAETGELNLYKNDATDNVEQCHIISSSPELQEAEEMEKENEDDINTDLEIVYSCINSSFKPTQPFSDKTADTMSMSPAKLIESSTIKEKCSLFLTENDVCDMDTEVSLNPDVSNFVSPVDNCSTSPIIFDCGNNVNNLDDDDSTDTLKLHASPKEVNEGSSTLPEISCPSSPTIFESENVAGKIDVNEDIGFPVPASPEAAGSHSDAEELNLCTIESNDSENSIEFLQSSYSSCKKLDLSTLNIRENVVLSLSSSDSQSTTLKDLSEHDSKLNTSQNSPKSESKKLLTFSKVSTQNIFNVCTKPESPTVSNSKTFYSQFHYHNSSANEAAEDFIEGLSNDDLNFSTKKFHEKDITSNKKARISDLTRSNKVSLEEKLNVFPSEECSSERKQSCFSFNSPCKSITQTETKYCNSAENTSVRKCDSPEVLTNEYNNNNEKSECNSLGETSIFYDHNKKWSKKEDFNFSPAVLSEAMNLSSPEVLAAESKSSDDPKFEFSDFSGNESGFFMPEEGQIMNTDCSEFSDKRNNVKKGAVATPDVKHPQFSISHSPITPFPDYKNMMTPEIKAALKRYGVKALPRKKAIQILSHVYNETHPMVNGEMDANDLQESTPKTSGKFKRNEPKKRKKLTEDHQKQTKKRQKENHQACNTAVSPESDDNKSDNPKWLECVPEMSFSQSTQDSPTKSTKEDIESVKEYMQSNIELYDNILSCKPLNLGEFHQELKNNNIKLSLQKLMDFLDEQCITFTLPRKEEYKKKQTARAQNFRKRMIAKLSQQT